MKRRHFIKSGALFVPTIFVPRLIRAQANTYRDIAWLINRNAPAAGGGGTLTWVTGQTIGLAIGPAPGYGCKFTVGGAGITVVQVGLWGKSDQYDSPIVSIRNAACTVLGSATITPPRTNDVFNYKVLGTPLSLSASTVYFITEDSGSQGMYRGTDTTITTTSAATCNDSNYDTCGLDGAGTGHCAGPMSFKYTIP